MPFSSSPAICNPLDLPYRYQDLLAAGLMRSVYREAADPSIVRFQGRYFMFASMSAGFWHSADLVSWEFHASATLPAYDYAPDVREIDGALYVTASRKGTPCPFFRSTDPLAGEFEKVTEGSFDFWDPNLFQDDDGKVYLYWGCDNKTPILGAEMDPTTMTTRTEPRSLIFGRPEQHGWERSGINHNPKNQGGVLATVTAKMMGTAPFIEGAWMTKREGTYYLQYSAPATEQNTYADGYYTSDSPLGPFTYAPDSPFSSKPGGFMTGAGHGSTFQDEYGNWWHAATMRVSVNFSFERRIGLFPAGFDDDGVLFCNQEFADYPMRVPRGPFDPWKDSFTGWMLLSYRKTASASSASRKHGPDLAFNEDSRTWWVADTADPGQSITVDLGEVCEVQAIQLNLADNDLKRMVPKPSRSARTSSATLARVIDTGSHVTEYTVEASLDGRSWATLHDNRGSGSDAPHGFVTLDEAVRYRYVRATGYQMPFGAPFAVSGLRVFGRGNGEAPPKVVAEAARTEARNALVRWEPAPTAHGYNVRYGRDPEKLYHSWMVYDQNQLDLSSLTAGEGYWVAVDAFNENGVTSGETVQIR